MFIGVLDKDSFKEECSPEKVSKKLEEIFSKQEAPFSLTRSKGGYVTADGKYVNEESLKITLIGEYNDMQISEFAEDLKTFFNQESILVITKLVEQNYVR